MAKRFMGINPKHKGFCTPMSKSTCTPRRKALAKTLKKHHGFHAEGGMIPEYKFGDIIKDFGSFAFGAGSGVASGLTFGLSNAVTQPLGQKLMASDGKITNTEQTLMGLGNMGGNFASMFINPAGGAGDIAKQAALGAIKGSVEDTNHGRPIPTFGQGGGVEDKTKPIIVNNPNDPRLKAYQDSLYIYNKSKEVSNNLYKLGNKPKVTAKEMEDWSNSMINDAVFMKHHSNLKKLNKQSPDLGDLTNVPFNKTIITDDGVKHNPFTFEYKKPVQPVVYQTPTAPITPVDKAKLISKPTMKYTKKITPAEQTKTYTNYNDYLKAKQAYGDSLSLYNQGNHIIDMYSSSRSGMFVNSPRETGFTGSSYANVTDSTPEYKRINDLQKKSKINPVSYSWDGSRYYDNYKKPVSKPEFQPTTGEMTGPNPPIPFVPKEEVKQDTVPNTWSDWNYKGSKHRSPVIPTFPNGGLTNLQPAQVEKEENVLMPNGQGVQFNGPSHEAGGINTLLPTNTMVFSDQLKTPEGKTFADANKPHISNIKNSDKNIGKYIGQDRKWSENSKKAAQTNSTNLFNQQEAMKNNKLMKSIHRAYMKYGGKIPKYAKGDLVGQGVNPYTEGAKGLLENSGNLMYLFGEGKTYDTVHSNPLTPSYLNPNEALNDIKGQSSISKYNIYNVGNGNSGNYLSNMIGLNNATNKSLATTRENYDNQNIGISNNFKQYNEQNRQRAEEATAQNKGTALSAYYDTLGQTGKNISNRWSTDQLSANQAGRDTEEFQWFKKLYPYIFNK